MTGRAGRSAMPGNPGLASLLADHGDGWEVERVGPGAQWVACKREQAGRYKGSSIVIVSARDLDGLRREITQAEREDAGEQDAG